MNHSKMAAILMQAVWENKVEPTVESINKIFPEKSPAEILCFIEYLFEIEKKRQTLKKGMAPCKLM